MLLSAGCDPEPPVLSVWAAASLADVLPRVGASFERSRKTRVRFSFAASSRLARQIEAGAPADVFVSADRRWMSHLEQAGHIVPSTRRALAGNRLAFVVPAAEEDPPSGAGELETVDRLALAGPAVPAGRYARAALEGAGVWSNVRDRIVRASHVRAALAWVARGEVDGGIVYATDARSEPRVQVAFLFPRDAHPPIVYPGAVVRGAAHPDLARAFVAFCEGSEARRELEAAGFAVPSPGDAPTTRRLDESAHPRRARRASP